MFNALIPDSLTQAEILETTTHHYRQLLEHQAPNIQVMYGDAKWEETSDVEFFVQFISDGDGYADWYPIMDNLDSLLEAQAIAHRIAHLLGIPCIRFGIK